MKVGRNSFIDNAKVFIRGSHNQIIICDDCRIGPKNTFRIIGDNLTIKIGSGLTSNQSIEYNANRASIDIGDDCMFSNNIIIRSSDDHAIYDMNSNDLINKPQDVKKGNHVWIAPNSRIMKGVHLSDVCVVATFCVVTHDVSSNCIAAGIPGMIIKENIKWDRKFLKE